jgi:hypothetical protein
MFQVSGVVLYFGVTFFFKWFFLPFGFPSCPLSSSYGLGLGVEGGCP